MSPDTRTREFSPAGDRRQQVIPCQARPAGIPGCERRTINWAGICDVCADHLDGELR